MDIIHAADDYLIHLQVEKNSSENTLRSYTYDLKCFQDFLIRHNRSMNLSDIIPSTVRRFVQDQVLNYGAKPKTLQRRVSCLKSFSQFCLREKIINQDFTAGIPAPKADKNLPVYMTLSETNKLFRFLEKDTRRFALRNELIFKLLVTTGLRRQELVDLTWDRVDLFNNTIRPLGKGKKERLLPLHEVVIPLFHKYQATLKSSQLNDSEPVFLNKNGHKMNPRGLHFIFKQILNEAGLPKKFSLHKLRHTFATLMIQQNTDNYNGVEKIDLRVLQELLGHESISSTAIYTHVDFSQKKRAISSFKI